MIKEKLLRNSNEKYFPCCMQVVFLLESEIFVRRGDPVGEPGPIPGAQGDYPAFPDIKPGVTPLLQDR